MRTLLGFIFVSVAMPMGVFAQSNFYYPNYFTAYYQNMSQITPAHVSEEGKAEFTSGYKSLTGAFRKISSYYFTGARAFRKKNDRVHVTRIQFYNEHEGSYISSPRAYANYAYQIPLGDNLKLFSGLALGLAGLYYSAPTTTQSSFMLPDGSIGLGLKSNWFEIGGSAFQILNETFQPVANMVTMKRYYHVYTSVQKEWPSDWKLKGYALVRTMPEMAQEYFGAVSISYSHHFIFGASMKYGAGVSMFALFGLESNEDRLQLLLNYNSPLFSLIPAYQSNLEIGLAYVLD